MPFLSYKAPWNGPVQYNSSLDLKFLLETALEMRVILQNSWRKGEIETEKSSADSPEHQRDTKSSDWSIIISENDWQLKQKTTACC